ncbi:MAG: aminoglycoside phosphotransferase family protein [Syntrophobacteraceae bacterium]|jgi:Ser/Thr protein kinase RdoA (MazF antagonist)|nr:aminoglycoside phosphotransferase family protein [Syntrophobacteraceae bacterium]
MSPDRGTLQDGELPTLAAGRFSPGHRIVEVRPLGNGHINDTYLVVRESEEEPRFVLQRINGRVFRDPASVVMNMRKVTDHGRSRLKQLTAAAPGLRFELPRMLTAEDGRDHWVDTDGGTWRAISFIENSRSFDAVQGPDHAREIGRALGLFHTAMSDLPADSLLDTLPGFHITPRVLSHYDEVLSKAPPPDLPEVAHCCRFVGRRRKWAGVLEDARARGRLLPRTIHGDPKVSNVMIDESTWRAAGLVDLDTVKPGLVHYDIGDCLRSSCNPLGGEARDWEAVRFEPDLCRAALEGYFEWAGRFLTPDDIDHLYDAIRLIAFELGARFLTDYLEGNVYFKVAHPRHNLARAFVQFRLTESIELQEAAIRKIIGELVSSSLARGRSREGFHPRL